MPFARFVEIQRTVADALADEARAEMQKAAFIGWQNYLVQPDYSKKAKKKMGFAEYQKKLGLTEKGQAREQMTTEEAVRLADHNDALVREAFKRAPAQA